MTYANLPDTQTPVWTWADPAGIEPQAAQQLRNIAALPWVHHHVAVMPDCHFGKGATVGSVIAMRDAVSPSAVGVDIGCGMSAVHTNLTASDLPDDLGALRSAVEAAIPVGFSAHQHPVDHPNHDRLWDTFPTLHEKVQDRFDRARAQMGTLGGGNHFVELCLDERDQVWLMLHSGSRGIGNQIAQAHIGIAKTLNHNAGLPDPDLAVFLAGTPEMAAYRRDLEWAQAYASFNRQTMMFLYGQVMRRFFPRIGAPARTVNCHHNYVAEEHHFGADVLVTRKGAISARAGEWGIIPGSMGTVSYIVRGLGNPDSFQSASHGAGRRMSRNQARKTFTVDDLAAQTAGVECRKDAEVVDEIPGAYKNISRVIAQQADLVEVVTRLETIMCVKG